MKHDLKISLKKPSYPVNDALKTYLQKFNRTIRLPIFYDDLLRFQGSVEVFDKNDRDTLWVRTYYNEFDRKEIDLNLKKIYTKLHSDGNETTIPLLNVDAIDYCTFGNSKPFRIKIRNILNDNYAYFYVKKADGTTDFDGWCWPGSSMYLDVTSPVVRDWWAGKFGLDQYVGSTKDLYIWNDMNEPSGECILILLVWAISGLTSRVFCVQCSTARR